MWWGQKNKLNEVRSRAQEFYNSESERALRISIGKETIPDEVFAAAIFGKVCEEIEKIQDIETMMEIANSNLNSKISADAKRHGFIDPLSAVQAMKEVVNARRMAFEKTLPKDMTYEMALQEEVQKIKEEIRKVQEE